MSVQYEDVEIGTSTLTVSGQATIPQNIREEMGLTEGDKVKFIHEDGETKVIKKSDGS